MINKRIYHTGGVFFYFAKMLIYPTKSRFLESAEDADSFDSSGV